MSQLAMTCEYYELMPAFEMAFALTEVLIILLGSLFLNRARIITLLSNLFRIIQTSDCKVVCFDRELNDNQIRTIEENAFLRIDVKNL